MDIKGFLKSLETSPADPIASFVGERIIGKFIPALGAYSIVRDVVDLGNWIDSKYPGFFTDIYQGSMDRVRYQQGETDPDMYYDPDKWLRDDVQSQRFGYTKPKPMTYNW